jgi:hypothetical protein
MPKSSPSTLAVTGSSPKPNVVLPQSAPRKSQSPHFAFNRFSLDAPGGFGDISRPCWHRDTQRIAAHFDIGFFTTIPDTQMIGIQKIAA